MWRLHPAGRPISCCSEDLSPDAVDPARAWRGLCSAVMGFIAKRSEGVTPELLAAAKGSALPMNCFDAEAAHPPTPAILHFIEEYAGRAGPSECWRIALVLQLLGRLLRWQYPRRSRWLLETATRPKVGSTRT